MNRRRSHVHPLVYALAVVVTACGGGTSASRQSPGPIDEQGGVAGTSGRNAATVCAMVPKEEVSQAIGMQVTEVNDVRTACEYHTMDPAVYVTIRVDKGRHAATAMEGSKMAANMFGANSDNAGKPPAQFGDDAVYGANDSLAVLKDGVYVSVMPPMSAVRSADNAAPQFLPTERKREIANTLAAKVLERVK
jgi:hypothetical protein